MMCTNADDAWTTHEAAPTAKAQIERAKTEWLSPPFKVRFEDHDDADVAFESLPPRRSGMRARYKFILTAAALLCCFLWSATPLPKTENQVALNEPATLRVAAPQEPSALSQQPDVSPDAANAGADSPLPHKNRRQNDATNSQK